MRIISFNANGLRSAASKGFFDWFAQQEADVLCVQETKAQEHQLAGPEFLPSGYRAWVRDATTKKGYSGVAIYSRREPDEIRTSLGWDEFDEEGRYIEARYGDLSVVSFYIPSGSSGELRQGFKFKVMDWLRPTLAQAGRGELVVDAPPHVVGAGGAAVAPPGVVLALGMQYAVGIHPATAERGVGIGQLVGALAVEPIALGRQAA